MNLDDFVDLASVEVDEVEKAIGGGNKYVITLLSGISCLLALCFTMLNNGFVEELASSRVVEND